MTGDPVRPGRRLPAVAREEQRAVAQVERSYGARVDVSALRAFLRRRYRSMMYTAVLIFALVATITFLLPRTYASDASFLVESEGVRSDGSALDVLQQIGQAVSRQTEIELIQSRRVLAPVVDSLGLRASATIAGEKLPAAATRQLVRIGPQSVPGLYEITRSDDSTVVVTTLSGETRVQISEDGSFEVGGVTLVAEGLDSWRSMELHIESPSRAIDAVRGRISAAEVRRDADLFRVTCMGETPHSAHDLCRQISSAYLNLKLEMQRAEAATAVGFLSEQAEKAEQQLKRAEDSLASFQRRAGAVALQQQASEQVRQAAELWAQREQIRRDRESMQLLIDRIESGAGGGGYRDLVSFPAFLQQQSQIVPRLVETLIELETRRGEVAVRRSDVDPEIVAIDERIAAIEDQLESIATGYQASLVSQESSLEGALAATGASLSSIPSRQAETIRLERQVTLYADLYTFLQTRLREAELAQAVEMPSVQVVDVASVPTFPASPRRGLNLAVGFIVATGMGLMMGLWREYTDTRLHEKRAIESEAGIPVLTMLPHIGKERRVLRVARPADGVLGATVVDPGIGQQVHELALEAMRTLAAELGFAAEDLDVGSMQAVAVTSSAQGDGKTFTACNLAIAKASQGFRVLLIDADFRGRGASRTFKIPPDTPGLSDVKPGRGYRSAPTVEVPIGDRTVLTVMPAGSGNIGAAELIGGGGFREVMEWGRKYYEFIVVDTPPLTLLSDAATVATLVDGVVVVVRSGKTDRAALEFTLERLDRARAHTVGIVLNDVNVPDYYRSYVYAE